MFSYDIITASQVHWQERIREAERAHARDRERRFGLGGVRIRAHAPNLLSRLLAALKGRSGSRQDQRRTASHPTPAR
jgi:hypothetical protein